MDLRDPNQLTAKQNTWQVSLSPQEKEDEQWLTCWGKNYPQKMYLDTGEKLICKV